MIRAMYRSNSLVGGCSPGMMDKANRRALRLNIYLSQLYHLMNVSAPCQNRVVDSPARSDIHLGAGIAIK